MYNMNVSSNKMEVNLETFPAGVYFVQLTGIDGFSFTKKFLKAD